MNNRNNRQAESKHEPALPDPGFPQHKMHAGVKRELIMVNRAIRIFWFLCGVSMLVGGVLIVFMAGVAMGALAIGNLHGPALLASGVVVAALLMLAPVIFRHKLMTLKQMKAAVLNELQFYRTADRSMAGEESKRNS